MVLSELRGKVKMKLQDLQKLHPDGHDFRIMSKIDEGFSDIPTCSIMWVEWIENSTLEKIYIKRLITSHFDNEYSFELW